MISSKISHNGPATGIFAYGLGRFWMSLVNWDVVGQVPKEEKFILIGSPHTSNWDFP